VQTLSNGAGELRFTDPDMIRAGTRVHKAGDPGGVTRGQFIPFGVGAAEP